MHSFFRTLVRNLSFEEDADRKSRKATNVQVVECIRFPVSHARCDSYLQDDDGCQHFPKQCPVAKDNVRMWDKKREKCQNCQHVYLKTLSRHPGFCSVDCKSNAIYITHINRAIKAAQTAAQQKNTATVTKNHDEMDDLIPQEIESIQKSQSDIAAGNSEKLDTSRADYYGHKGGAHSFGEFDLEERVGGIEINWPFSAMY